MLVLVTHCERLHFWRQVVELAAFSIVPLLSNSFGYLLVDWSLVVMVEALARPSEKQCLLVLAKVSLVNHSNDRLSPVLLHHMERCLRLIPRSSVVKYRLDLPLALEEDKLTSRTSKPLLAPSLAW